MECLKMATKYEGSYDSASLHDLMDKGKVYIECPNCGAHMSSWITVMAGKCHKCNQPHGIGKQISNAEAKKKRDRAEERYGFLQTILAHGGGCVYTTVSGGTVSACTGSQAWAGFVNSFMDSPHTCLKCSACGYLHIVTIWGDRNWAGDLYSVGRAEGYCATDNWKAAFRCLSCGRQNTARVNVSFDPQAPKGKQHGHPFGYGRMVRNHGKWWRLFGLVLFFAYLLSYILMSLGGHRIVANHGGSDWRREWCPRFLVEDYTALSGRTRTTLTPLGRLYWPCIGLDHLLWHRTQAASLSGVSESDQATGEGSKSSGVYYGDPARVGDLKGAVLYFMHNDRWQDAEATMRAIINTNEKYGDTKALVNNYSILGLTLKMLRKHDQELAVYEQELRLAKTLSPSDPASECEAWLDLASAQVALGSVSAAQNSLEQAKQIAQRSNLQEELGAIQDALRDIGGFVQQPAKQ